MDAIELTHTRYPSSLYGPALLPKPARSWLESAPYIHHHHRLLPGRLLVAKRKACHRLSAAMAGELSRRNPLATEQSLAGGGERALQTGTDTGVPTPRPPRSPQQFPEHWNVAVPA